MAILVRGAICWAELGPVRGREQAGRKPVVILSQDIFNEKSGTVTAMALTSRPQKAGYPLTYELSASLLGRRAWVKISQIRTLSADRIGKRIGQLDLQHLDRLVDGLRRAVRMNAEIKIPPAPEASLSERTGAATQLTRGRSGNPRGWSGAPDPHAAPIEHRPTLGALPTEVWRPPGRGTPKRRRLSAEAERPRTP